jgi:SAM-dependent methyltransferase
MFWFNRKNPLALYQDKRREMHTLKDKSSTGGSRELVIDPDHIGDFTNMVFPDESFSLVVFDPPHLVGNGATGWLAKKYGKLGSAWRDDIRKGFAECFRVLKPEGTLIFKWNEQEIPVSEILKLTPNQPLFGNRCGKTSKSHWLVFLPSAEPQQSGGRQMTTDTTTDAGPAPMHCVFGWIHSCGEHFPKRGGAPEDKTGCILPDKHDGNHLFKSDDNRFYSWQWDFCGCPDCMSEDAMDQCCVYSEALQPSPRRVQEATGVAK